MKVITVLEMEANLEKYVEMARIQDILIVQNGKWLRSWPWPMNNRCNIDESLFFHGLAKLFSVVLPYSSHKILGMMSIFSLSYPIITASP